MKTRVSWNRSLFGRQGRLRPVKCAAGIRRSSASGRCPGQIHLMCIPATKGRRSIIDRLRFQTTNQMNGEVSDCRRKGDSYKGLSTHHFLASANFTKQRVDKRCVALCIFSGRVRKILATSRNGWRLSKVEGEERPAVLSQHLYQLWACRLRASSSMARRSLPAIQGASLMPSLSAASSTLSPSVSCAQRPTSYCLPWESGLRKLPPMKVGPPGSSAWKTRVASKTPVRHA